MNIIITARDRAVPTPVQRRAEKNLRGLQRFDPQIQEAEVIFDVDAGLHRVEARLTVIGGPMVVAQGDERTFGAALDRVVARLKRQLRRRRARERARRTDRPDPKETATV